MPSSSGLELIGTGIVMGVVHVLTGPDHLSALATLSGTNIGRHHTLLPTSDDDDDGNHTGGMRGMINTTGNILGNFFVKHCCNKNYARYDAFLLGVRWGIGHSVGLLLVGGILIAVESSSTEEWIGMDDTVSAVFESFVGVFMLVVGVYGLCKAFRNREENAMGHSSSSLGGGNQQVGGGSGGILVATTEMEMNYPERGYGDCDGDGDGDDDDDDDDQEMNESIQSQSRQLELTDIISEMEMCLVGEENVLDYSNRDDGIDNTTSQVKCQDRSVRVSVQQQDGDYMDSFFNSSLRSTDNTVMTVPMDQLLGGGDDQADTDQNPHTDRPFSRKSSRRSLSSKGSRLDRVPPTPPSGSDVDECEGDNCSMSRASTINMHHHHYALFNKCCFYCTPGTLALATGIVHGVAGPGGVLGVIPAVQLKEARLAMIYLGTFCVTSTLVMGSFAAFYRGMSEWMAGVGDGNRVFMVEVGSSCLSIIVGIVWLVLLSMGTLEEVFP